MSEGRRERIPQGHRPGELRLVTVLLVVGQQPGTTAAATSTTARRSSRSSRGSGSPPRPGPTTQPARPSPGRFRGSRRQGVRRERHRDRPQVRQQPQPTLHGHDLDALQTLARRPPRKAAPHAARRPDVLGSPSTPPVQGCVLIRRHRTPPPQGLGPRRPHRDGPGTGHQGLGRRRRHGADFSPLHSWVKPQVRAVCLIGRALRVVSGGKHVERIPPCLRTLRKLQVRAPLRQAQGSRHTPHDASSGTGRTPAASAPCTPRPGSTPGPVPAPPGRRPRRRSCGRPAPTGA